MRRLAVLVLAAACSKTATPAPPDAGPDGPPLRSCATAVTYKPASPAIQVAIAGEWNGFSTTADRLRQQPDGSYSTSLTLDAGEYAYKLVVDGQYVLDPGNPWTRYSGGVLNSALRVPDCHTPLITVASFAAASGALEATLQLTDAADAHGLDAAGFKATLDGATLAPQQFTPQGQVMLHAAGLAKGKHVVRVAFSDRANSAARDLYLPFWLEDVPFEWRDAALYFAMIDRFKNGDPSNDRPVAGVDAAANFQGGDFAGLEQQLEAGWFDQLGIRALWISNPQQQPQGKWPGSDSHQYTGYHGYWPASATATDARFGSMQELQAAIDAAHKRGIRVLLDFVANHVHQEHPWWAQQQKPASFFNPLHLADGRTCLCSTAPGFCSYDPPEGLSCWFAEYLPDINYTDPQAMPAVEDEAVQWLHDTGADGLRVDAVKQFPHIVGTRLRARLHEELEQSGVPTYLVGETYVFSWSSGGQDLVKQFVSPTELHGQFDFPLYWELRAALAEGSSSGFVPVEAALSGEQGFYGPQALMSPFLGNHDLPRFLSLAAGQQTGDSWNNLPGQPTDPAPYALEQLGFTLLFTIPGMPLIWQGDETSMPGAGDPDNRRMMQFDNLTSLQQQTLTRVRALGQLRQATEALRRGSYRTLSVDSEVLVYARQLPGQRARVVALNRNASAQQRSVALPPDLLIPDGTQLTDALGGASTTAASGHLAVSLGARSAAIF